MDRRTFLAAAIGACSLGARAERSTGRIRVGQIGTSHSHAAGKMKAVRSLEAMYEVVGIAEPIPERRDGARRDPAYAGLKWTSEDALLADPAVEAVLVETTLDDSARAAAACLRAGKHVHLDKPGSGSHTQFAAMRRDAAGRGLTVQVGYMLRYNPAFELLFRGQREGWFGTITEIDAAMGKLADAELLAQLAGHPGYGMFELACHLVDAVVRLLGTPDAVHAFARKTGLGTTDIPDNQLAVLEYPRATATIRCNHGDPFGAPHRCFRVTGTRGAMEIQPLESGKGVLYLSEAVGGFARGENRFALDVPKGRYDGEFRDLARVVRGGAPLAWSAEHDIAVHATALRCAGLSP